MTARLTMAGSVLVEPVGMRALRVEMGLRFATMEEKEFKKQWNSSDFH